MNSMHYGYCPICGAEGVIRERKMDGNDGCKNGHIYPSKDRLLKTPKTFEEKVKEFVEELDYDLYKELFVYDTETGDEVIQKAREIFDNQ